MSRPNACVMHGKPCVHMHANGHAYKWDVFVEEGGGRRKGKEKGKGEKKKEKRNKIRGKEREKEEGGRQFLPQFISISTVRTRWTKE